MDRFPASPSQASMLSYELKETQSTAPLRHDSSALNSPIQPSTPVPIAERNGPSRPWRTGFLLRFPIWGFTSWCFALIFTIAGVVVLVISNGVPVDNWDSRMQPTVWLALTSMLTGALLAHAFTEAAAIAWWRKATGPTSLEELHNWYESSTNLWTALCNLVRLRTKLLGLASIIMTLSAIRSPLLQRASTTTNVHKINNGTFEFHIAQELPEDYGAIHTGRSGGVSLLTRNFSDIAQSYSNREPMMIAGPGCFNCSTSVKAFGFKVNCTTTQRDFDIAVSGSDFSSAMDGAYLFQVNVTNYGESETWDSKDGAFMRITTLYKETGDCKGQLPVQTCDLHGGISNISVRIDGSQVNMVGKWKDDHFLETRYMLPLKMKDANLIGGFTTVISTLYGSDAHMSFVGARGWDISTRGLPATQYMAQNGTTPSCNDKWSNPMDDLIEVARELGFRASLRYAASNASEAPQQVPYESGVTILVYVTDYGKMALGFVVSLIGVLAVLPVFWGWWELGRNVSLNPLEIASAFEQRGGDPIFRGADPNATPAVMVRGVNDSAGKIQYGALEGEEGVRLGFARAGTIRKPGEGERFVY